MAARDQSYGGDSDYVGKTVDDNMIMLRMRIRENKLVEMTKEPPMDWMEWEKKYYANNGYNEDVYQVLGFLQNYLMNVRPGLALGLILVLGLSLVLSTGVVFSHAIQMVRALVNNVHM